MDTEYISRASRALAWMTLARQVAAIEIAVSSGVEHETWIHRYRAEYRSATGWITVVVISCCILKGLPLLWRKSGEAAETSDTGTQTLEEGRCAQDIPSRIMITARPRIADAVAFFHIEITHDPISDLVFSLRSKRRFGEARVEAAHWVMRTSFGPQSVVCQFPVSQICCPQFYTRFSCCTHPDHDAPFQTITCDRFTFEGTDRHECFLSYLLVLVSMARECGSDSVHPLALFTCRESSCLMS